MYLPEIIAKIREIKAKINQIEIIKNDGKAILYHA